MSVPVASPESIDITHSCLDSAAAALLEGYTLPVAGTLEERRSRIARFIGLL